MAYLCSFSINLNYFCSLHKQVLEVSTDPLNSSQLHFGSRCEYIHYWRYILLRPGLWSWWGSETSFRSVFCLFCYCSWRKVELLSFKFHLVHSWGAENIPYSSLKPPQCPKYRCLLSSHLLTWNGWIRPDCLYIWSFWGEVWRETSFF